MACDDVSVAHDEPVLKMKEEVESLWQGGLSNRSRKSLAMRLGIKGFNICADNVGKVITIDKCKKMDKYK